MRMSKKDNKRIRFGTGNISGNYYSYGTNLSNILEKETADKYNIINTAGSSTNLRLICEGYLDLAIIQSDIISQGISQGSTGFHSITGLYSEGCHYQRT